MAARRRTWQRRASWSTRPPEAGAPAARSASACSTRPAQTATGRCINAVVESNVRAVALWHSLGFEVLATVPEAFDHPTDGLVGLHIMHRPL